MQITKAQITPLELTFRRPLRLAGKAEIGQVTALFVRLDTRQGHTAWGATIAHPELNGQDPKKVLSVCQAAASLIPDLHPTNIEFSLARLAPIVAEYPAALCAFDLAFHDLLGLAAGMPLYRLLGGFRNKIQTSATVPLTNVTESVEIAERHARQGFQLLKIKGGVDPEEDVHRVRRIHRALPKLPLRLDADGGYDVQQAIDVARALGDNLEMLEQPTPPGDLEGLRQVRRNSPVPVLADQSVTNPASALEIAMHHYADGLSIKVGACGGLRCASQMDAIARAAQLTLMVSCLVEPALLIAAGLSFALSSPAIRYCDLDGHLELSDDPTLPGFKLAEGYLIASDVPGLGCTVEL